MSRPRSGLAALKLVALALAMGPGLGCGGDKAPPGPPARPAGPLAIRRPDSTMRVFSGEDETPPAVYSFEGAGGSVRVTMEVDAGSSSVPNPPPAAIHDVLFKAEGAGRVTIIFKRPWPDHPNGRVTIRCLSGDEESAAEFEPELWYHLPGAIVTQEGTSGDPTEPVAPGKEVVLGRYVARNIPRDVRLTFKAVFSRDPVAPRTKAGIKPPR